MSCNTELVIGFHPAFVQINRWVHHSNRSTCESVILSLVLTAMLQLCSTRDEAFMH